MCLGRVAGTPRANTDCSPTRWAESPRIARRVQVLRRVFAKEKESNITLAIQTLDIAQVGCNPCGQSLLQL